MLLAFHLAPVVACPDLEATGASARSETPPSPIKSRSHHPSLRQQGRSHRRSGGDHPWIHPDPWIGTLSPLLL
jgi:hypothetical protein